MTLSLLKGAWSGAEMLSPSPWSPGGPASGRHVFAVGTGGTTLVQDYVEERDGAVSLTGHGVFTVDPDTGDVLWFWFDSIGFPPAAPSRGAWEDGTLTLVKETPRGAQRAMFRVDGDTLHLRIEARPGDAEAFSTVVAATYAREGR